MGNGRKKKKASARFQTVALPFGHDSGLCNALWKQNSTMFWIHHGFGEQNPHWLKAAAWARAGTLLFYLAGPASQSWAGAVQSLLDLPVGRSISYLSSQLVPQLQQRAGANPVASGKKNCPEAPTVSSAVSARMDTAPVPQIPTRVACTPPWSAYRLDLHRCRPNRALRYNPQG